ncbi:hypothetical protein M8C13_32420 [Crossiella sp. SN42]|uniref:hypothetical protein n=1 Tax=Crossiella sp. SN42 TaxID=2944808 RepID=UPI00207C5535|nr:hypothetical protein [Crossiella sp. SN42]MCO1580469.1 hypothetical protein [Crossiella sp. SN42]
MTAAFPELFRVRSLCQWKLVATLYLRPDVTEVLSRHPLSPALASRIQRPRPFTLPVRVALTLRWTAFYACGMAVPDIAVLDNELSRIVYRRLEDYNKLVLNGAGVSTNRADRFERRPTPAELDRMLQEFVQRMT